MANPPSLPTSPYLANWSPVAEAELLFRLETPERLAEAIEKMLADSDLRRRMGLAGQKKAREYEGTNLWRRTCEELERVASRTWPMDCGPVADH